MMFFPHWVQPAELTIVAEETWGGGIRWGTFPCFKLRGMVVIDGAVRHPFKAIDATDEPSIISYFVSVHCVETSTV